MMREGGLCRGHSDPSTRARSNSLPRRPSLSVSGSRWGVGAEMAAVALVPKVKQDHAKDKEGVISCLEELLKQAKKGEIVGLHAVLQYDQQYVYKRVGISYVETLGMLHRAAYALNKEWDSL